MRSRSAPVLLSKSSRASGLSWLQLLTSKGTEGVPRGVWPRGPLLPFICLQVFSRGWQSCGPPPPTSPPIASVLQTVPMTSEIYFLVISLDGAVFRLQKKLFLKRFGGVTGMVLHNDRIRLDRGHLNIAVPASHFIRSTLIRHLFCSFLMAFVV